MTSVHVYTGVRRKNRDAGYVAGRVGAYQIVEGAGPDGGFWFAKGRGEVKRFRSRAEAEEHAGRPGSTREVEDSADAIPSQNETWGFNTGSSKTFGTVADKIKRKFGLSDEEARDFLDSRYGRHLSDAIRNTGSIDGLSWLADAVRQFKKEAKDASRDSVRDSAATTRVRLRAWNKKARDCACGGMRDDSALQVNEYGPSRRGRPGGFYWAYGSKASGPFPTEQAAREDAKRNGVVTDDSSMPADEPPRDNRETVYHYEARLYARAVALRLEADKMKDLDKAQPIYKRAALLTERLTRSRRGVFDGGGDML